ncbi:MAG: alpha/beta hydrolase [Planctomycetia bacterium]|nr:alpha/beta hydrolase [Planctomycetia bacterium]
MKSRNILLVLFSWIGLSLLLYGEEQKEKINIWPNGAKLEEGKTEPVEVNLLVYLPEESKATGQGIVICPGGGYGVRCIDTEGYPIAKWLNDHGIAGFILEYRLPQGKKVYAPLNDAQRAIRTVRANAAKWKVNPHKIGIIGFSAGGHLASSAIVHYDSGNPASSDPIERVSCRLDFGILVYPVVDFVSFGHKGSCKNLLGNSPSEDLIRYFSNHNWIDEKTPPCFLTHAKDDKVVPISNSRIFAEQMKKYNRPVFLMEHEKGGHGLFGCKGPVWETWKSRCIDWLKTLNEHE